MKKIISILASCLCLIFMPAIMANAEDMRIYGEEIQFSVAVTDCTDNKDNGEILVEIVNPDEDCFYYVSFDMLREKYYKINVPKKLNFTKAKKGNYYISILKKNKKGIKTNSETVTVNVENGEKAHPIKISTENTSDQIFKDGKIMLYIDNYDESKKYEVNINGGKSWKKMSKETVSIIKCQGGIYKICVREEGKKRKSATLKVYVAEPETGKHKYIPVDMVLQKPELPTGCEITSLTMLLNYIGYDVDKVDMSDNYLPKGEYRAADYRKVFVGNPRSIFAYGCFSKAIVKAAENYLDEFDEEDKWEVRNITGCSSNSLYAAVDNGYPVVVWASVDLKGTKAGKSWVVRETGETVTWVSGEHCLLLTGYDKDKKEVYINDPLKGSIAYDMQLFETRFDQLGQEAVIIVPCQEK